LKVTAGPDDELTYFVVVSFYGDAPHARSESPDLNSFQVLTASQTFCSVLSFIYLYGFDHPSPRCLPTTGPLKLTSDCFVQRQMDNISCLALSPVPSPQCDIQTPMACHPSKRPRELEEITTYNEDTSRDTKVRSQWTCCFESTLKLTAEILETPPSTSSQFSKVQPATEDCRHCQASLLFGVDAS
jgi:hypothetical protein